MNRRDKLVALFVATGVALFAAASQAQSGAPKGTNSKPSATDKELASLLVDCGQQLLVVGQFTRNSAATMLFAADYNKRAVIVAGIKYVQEVMPSASQRALEVKVKLKNGQDGAAWIAQMGRGCRALAAKVSLPKSARQQVGYLGHGATRERIVALLGEPDSTKATDDKKKEVMSYVDHPASDLDVDAFGNLPVGKIEDLGSKCDMVLADGLLQEANCH